MSLDEISDEITGKKREEQTPDPKEYVKIKGIWQHTDCSWFVDKEKMNAPVPSPMKAIIPGAMLQYSPNNAVENFQCVAHVHHWKTELEEYCKVDQDWKCVRCHDEVPGAIQSMIKLYRPLKDV